MPQYRHTQRSLLLVLFLLPPVAGLVALAYFMPELRWVLGLVAVGLLVSLALFYQLTIEITDKELRWAFGVGLVRKQVPLAEIASAEAGHSRWYHGWGIHYTGFGWLYNVEGFDVVKVGLKSGSHFALGTDEPAQLEAAIRSAVTGSSA
ncbi:MAG: hypothetical protein ACOY3P_08420 [Planctomycetota bacterium]